MTGAAGDTGTPQSGGDGPATRSTPGRREESRDTAEPSDGGSDPDAVFDTLGTIGIEEEFYIVDESGRPTAGIDDLVYGADPPAILDGRLDHELFQCTIETQSPVIDDPSAVGETIRDIRAALVDHAAAHGYGIAAAGLHPAARWPDLAHATKPRYRSQLDRIRYPQQRNLTSGVHVHVGVDDPDRAVWIANELRWYGPLLLALAANSPFWCGSDTGLASARAVIFENLPHTGTPTTFDSYDAYRRFERRMIRTESVADRGELWYDVRPHTELGTVEVRVPDAQRDPDRVAALVEAVHGLVIDLATRHADGESGHDDRREIVDANKWRAARYGRAASFVPRSDAGAGPQPPAETVELDEWTDRLCDRLGIDGLRTVLDADSGAREQRRMRSEGGMDALCDALRLDRDPGGF